MKKKIFLLFSFALLFLFLLCQTVFAGESRTMTLRVGYECIVNGSSVKIISGEDVVELYDAPYAEYGNGNTLLHSIEALAEGSATVQVDDTIWNITVSEDWTSEGKENYHWAIVNKADDKNSYPKLVISGDAYYPKNGESVDYSGKFAYDAYFSFAPWAEAAMYSADYIEKDNTAVGICSAEILPGANGKKVKPVFTKEWFWFPNFRNESDTCSLKNISMSGLDTSEVIDMSNMFAHCDELTTLDLSNWNTSKVTNMSNMFAYCEALTTLDLSKWNTANVTDMNSMFTGCEALNTLNVSNWNTSKVVDMSYMFCGLGLKAENEVNIIGLSGFKTGNVKSMSCMFENLESYSGGGKLSNDSLAGVSGWDVSNVQNFSYMFYGQGEYLTTLDLSEWDTSSAVTFLCMFTDCMKLKRLDLSGWDVHNVIVMRNMFDDCVKLITIGDVSGWNTSSLIDPTGLFNGCCSFTGEDGVLDLSGWNTSKVISFGEMFRSIRVNIIDLSGWTTECLGNSWKEQPSLIYGVDINNYYSADVNYAGTQVMFLNCSELTTIYVNPNTVFKKQGIQSEGMFLCCGDLKGRRGSTLAACQKTDNTYARVDGGPGNEGYFSVIKYNFSDVTAQDYFYDAVQWATTEGIVDGVDANHFAPNDKVTRAQMVTFLWRAAGSPVSYAGNCRFNDVNKDDYYYNAVSWAVSRGITEGVSDVAFMPKAAVTRAQAAAFLWRMAGGFRSYPVEDNNPFTDVKAGDYFYKAVLWLNDRGITSGVTDTTFEPDATCTRAEVVTFLWRSIVNAEVIDVEPDGLIWENDDLMPLLSVDSADENYN